MIIDSSHNIFIDILAQYGLIGLVFFLSVIVLSWRKLDLTGKSGLLLGLVFLSLNVFVISHIIVILYLLSLRKKPV